MATPAPEVGKAVEGLLKTFPPRMLIELTVAGAEAAAKSIEALKGPGPIIAMLIRTSPLHVVGTVVTEATKKGAEEARKRVEEVVPK